MEIWIRDPGTDWDWTGTQIEHINYYTRSSHSHLKLWKTKIIIFAENIKYLEGHLQSHWTNNMENYKK
jgi:hypothetical protein